MLLAKVRGGFLQILSTSLNAVSACELNLRIEHAQCSESVKLAIQYKTVKAPDW